MVSEKTFYDIFFSSGELEHVPSWFMDYIDIYKYTLILNLIDEEIICFMANYLKNQNISVVIIDYFTQILLERPLQNGWASLFVDVADICPTNHDKEPLYTSLLKFRIAIRNCGKEKPIEIISGQMIEDLRRLIDRVEDSKK